MSGIKIATVANAIEAISIAGVTVKDLDNIPVTATVRDCFLIPKPDGFVTNLQITRQSQGTTAQGRKADVTYTLTYLLIVGVVGAGRADVLDYYADVIGKAVLVMNAVEDLVTLAGAVDIIPAGVSSFITVTSGANTSHPGLELSFDVVEFYEV